MKMPNKMDKKMVAICGMNCTVCYKHLMTKKYAKSCNGCKQADETLPNHCRKCRIKDCAKSKKLEYCFECETYPCQWIKAMDKSYQQRYQTSLIQNGIKIKQEGITRFLQQAKEQWSCSTCEGIISLHDRICSECLKSIQ